MLSSAFEFIVVSFPARPQRMTILLLLSSSSTMMLSTAIAGALFQKKKITFNLLLSFPPFLPPILSPPLPPRNLTAGWGWVCRSAGKGWVLGEGRHSLSSSSSSTTTPSFHLGWGFTILNPRGVSTPVIRATRRRWWWSVTTQQLVRVLLFLLRCRRGLLPPARKTAPTLWEDFLGSSLLP